MTDFDIKVKFLRDLGIQQDKYPSGFFDTIENLNQLLTNTEIGYCSDYDRCGGKTGTFCIKDVVGTDHERYAGHTWIDAFLDLDRGASIISKYEENPEYWEEIKKEENSDFGLIKLGDKYYIFGKAGGGNNRLITMKIRYLALIEQANGNPSEIERINKEFTFVANVRELPEDYEIPFVVVAMSEDLRGFSVKKSGDLYTVYKKFTDIELFKGDNIGLKEYFRDLFDTSLYSEEEVKNRLEGIEMGCHFSPKKHREVLENIIPQLKPDNVPSSGPKI